MNWDDLRYVLAVARHNSLSGAARALGVNHSTVFRRIGAIEDRLKVRLFERLSSGYVPTPAGQEAFATAKEVEAEMTALERRITGADLRLSGTIRLTTTETLAYCFLPSYLGAFRKRHPGIELELMVTNQNLNLTKREADLAIRPTNKPPKDLIGQRVATVAFAIYGAKHYFTDNSGKADLSDLEWVSWDETRSVTTMAKWLKQTYPTVKPIYRVDSMVAMLAAVRAGAGLAVLPCLAGDGMPDLRRIGGVLSGLSNGLWLLTHPDLRHNARIRAFMTFMKDRINVDRDLLAGDRAATPGGDQPPAG
jgi:DNA-binding transcriptional LysR family regulator